MVQESNEILIGSIKWGLIPSVIIALIIMLYIRKRFPEMSLKRRIMWFLLSVVLCLLGIIPLLVFLFILLMSGALFNS